MEMDRRAFLGLMATAALMPMAGCSSTASSSSSTSAANAAASASAASSVAVTATAPSSMTLAELLAQTQSKFSSFTYTDPQTGTSIDCNLCPPDGYDSSKTYPLITFIADASSVGKGTAFSLTQGYGGLVWASDYDQQKHPSFVLVPAYDATIIDDNSGSTKTDLLEITARLIDAVASSYSIDKARLYATGQSMGCMTMLYLAANHPDLVAAEMFVDGQWDTNDLPHLPSQKFCYFAAGGDVKASQGQTDVEALLTANNVPYATTTLDATWSSDQINATAQALLDEGRACNFLSWTAGSVITANPGKNMEHMASFDPAYKVDAVRDWLYRQSR